MIISITIISCSSLSVSDSAWHLRELEPVRILLVLAMGFVLAGHQTVLYKLSFPSLKIRWIAVEEDGPFKTQLTGGK